MYFQGSVIERATEKVAFPTGGFDTLDEGFKYVGKNFDILWDDCDGEYYIALVRPKGKPNYTPFLIELNPVDD
jgi:hypothetical protein